MENNQAMKQVIMTMLAILLLVSCNSIRVTVCEERSATIADACEHSGWLDQKIELLKTMNTTARLTQYTYQSKPVFKVRTCLECADTMTTVYSCEGVIICQFGGIAGFNTYPDFFETAPIKRLSGTINRLG